MNADAYLNLVNGSLRDMEQFMLQGRTAEFYRAQLVLEETPLLRRIQAALMASLDASLIGIRRFAQGETLDLLGILLSDADLNNARFLLRGALYGASKATTPLWRGYGMLSALFYDHLWHTCSNLQDICECCRENSHPVAQAIASAFMKGAGHRNIRQIERGLLFSFLNYWHTLSASSASNNGEVLRRYLLLLRDIWNLGIWFRGTAASVNSDDFDIGDALKDLNLSDAFLSLSSGAQKRQPRTRREWHYRLRFGVLEWLRNLFRANPLGIEVLMGYMAMELIEWHNLNVVVSGLSFSMSPEHIYGRLIPVKGM